MWWSNIVYTKWRKKLIFFFYCFLLEKVLFIISIGLHCEIDIPGVLFNSFLTCFWFKPTRGGRFSCENSSRIHIWNISVFPLFLFSRFSGSLSLVTNFIWDYVSFMPLRCWYIYSLRLILKPWYLLKNVIYVQIENLVNCVKWDFIVFLSQYSYLFSIRIPAQKLWYI